MHIRVQTISKRSDTHIRHRRIKQQNRGRATQQMTQTKKRNERQKERQIYIPMGTKMTCLVADAASLVRFQNDENDGRAVGDDGGESILETGWWNLGDMGWAII